MNFYDETTRQLLALFLSLGTLAVAIIVVLRIRAHGRLKRTRLRRDLRRS